MFPVLRAALVIAVAIAIISIPSGPAAAEPPIEKGKPADLFAETRILPVHITMTAKEFDAMQPPSGGFGFPGPFGGPMNPPKKPADGREVHRNAFGLDLPWAVGSVVVDGASFDKIGIRYKGNGTIMDAARTIKKSIKLDLDRHDQSQRYRGLKTLNLHSGVADPSKAR
jgi:spore coat protein H